MLLNIDKVTLLDSEERKRAEKNGVWVFIIKIQHLICRGDELFAVGGEANKKTNSTNKYSEVENGSEI